MSDKEKDFIKKIESGVPYLSDFDKGYFLGIVESKANSNMDKAVEERNLSRESTKQL
ncbi:MAG: hypothetical protein NC393_09585 [Clostridium sp.]|nr:hypothetical protein [Clostridium sp.]MCM1207796.1 hypothetical protein [Ruminococcus sp.]